MRSRRNAMSLLELTLVILLLGVMAALATPRFSDAVRLTKLQATAHQIAAHIDHIRREAITEGRSTTLICDNDAHGYRCPTADFPDRVGEPLVVSVRQLYDPTYSLEANFDSQTQLSFDLEGVPMVGSTPMSRGTITLTTGAETFTIIVAAGSGATRLVRGSVVDAAEAISGGSS